MSEKLRVSAGGSQWEFEPSATVAIGRSPDSDIVLSHRRVSARHGLVRHDGTSWVYTDAGSSNGTWASGRRVTGPEPVRSTLALGLGSADDHVAVTLVATAVPAPPAHLPPVPEPVRRTPPQGGWRMERSPTTVHPVDQVEITIGRDPGNTVVLNDLLVSRRHATLRRSGSRWELLDLGSANGTFVNGKRIDRAPIGPDDVIGIGHQLLCLQGDRLVEYVDTGDVSYEASGLQVVTEQGKVLLSGVSFSLPERCFMAVLGPSGAGKSTLLGALTGLRPAGQGSVHYDGRDFYENYAELRQRIGFVPQDDILHTQLTVRRALDYAARLRFPQDVSASERERRIDEVLAELGLVANADQRIDSLSGGQRKRTSVALELLTKPSLLFLDEPTSGLDPGYEKSVMKTLRGLADDGRSVVVVTHNIAQLDLCDRLLILAPGGRLAYFGPPQEALAYFACTDYADLFTLLEHDTTTDWTGRFEASLRHRGRGPVRPPRPGAPSGRPFTKPARPQSGFNQFVTLCRRYLSVIAADRQYTVTLLALPLLLSLFAYAVPGGHGLSVERATEPGAGQTTQPVQLMVLLIIGGALMGCAASVREIVKERAIYQRERGIGLSHHAYLASKIVVLTLVTSIQGLTLGLVATALRPGPDEAVLLPWPNLEVALAVVAVAVVSMLVGLLISAMIDNADRGMPLLVVVVMAQLVLCGGLFPVNGQAVLEQLALLSPSRWAFAMGASTADLNAIREAMYQFTQQKADPLWDHDARDWAFAAGGCLALGFGLIVLLVLRLRRFDPSHRARGRRRVV